jgi:hypothetical protein
LTGALEVGSPPQIWKTHVALARLHTAWGRLDDARLAYRAALEVIGGVAARLTDERLRETFLRSGEVEALRRAASG